MTENSIDVNIVPVKNGMKRVLQITVRSPESAAVMWMARKIKKQN